MQSKQVAEGVGDLGTWTYLEEAIKQDQACTGDNQLCQQEAALLQLCERS